MILEVYADGGQILASPSPYGGTWAFVMVADGVVVDEESGLLLPHHLGTRRVTNNDAEMYALLRALEAAPDGADVAAHSDSECTLKRFARIARGQRPTKTMHPELSERAEWAFDRLGVVTFAHLKGHPTKEDLARGHNDKGQKVSQHQVRCDELCTEQATRFLDDLRRTA